MYWEFFSSHDGVMLGVVCGIGVVVDEEVVCAGVVVGIGVVVCTGVV